MLSSPNVHLTLTSTTLHWDVTAWRWLGQSKSLRNAPFYGATHRSGESLALKELKIIRSFICYVCLYVSNSLSWVFFLGGGRGLGVLWNAEDGEV